ncbi:hypothetical protein V1498_21545 [Peribacillus sp. SCS-26]|uniref:hypothetical protein n=1 Tax=Paraperibacillus marinus TaxID=3115295 RepID=UPI00390582E9
MTGRILHYFVCGHTARGFVNLGKGAFTGIKKLFVLKSESLNIGSELIREIGEEMAGKGWDIEFIHSPFNGDAVDGVVLPGQRIGIVNYLIAGEEVPGCEREIIQVDEGPALSSLLEGRINEQLKHAYSKFSHALSIHDEWEKFYISSMDFKKADELTDELIGNLLGENRNNKKAVARHRYLGAATPRGSVDFVPNLTESLRHRFFIKGRPGSGKSTLLKKLAKQAEARGFDTEIYHCGFDPESLDMVIVRELGFAIFDSTAPHEYFPEREGDSVIDMYGTVIAEGTDEKYESELKDVSARYKEQVQAATAHLKEAYGIYNLGLESGSPECAGVHKTKEKLVSRIYQSLSEN